MATDRPRARARRAATRSELRFRLADLGVYGFNRHETAILAALVTLEHPESLSVFELARRVSVVLSDQLAQLRRTDARWTAKWSDAELLVNPNGPLSDAGSRKDNGQTGRKLVMDYYGPRVPLGGGAIYGKDPMHVDRFGARKARELAVDTVKRGAGGAWSGRCMRRMSRSPWMCRSRCRAGCVIHRTLEAAPVRI